MKTTILFITLCFISSLSANIGLNHEDIPIYSQLIDLNSTWKYKQIDNDILNQKSPQKNDVELIQLHLSLVEKELRITNYSHLTEDQKKYRQLALDILHQYWQHGVFPKNTYHSERTPYFIDKYGTACAVGQLMISTGYGDLAEKISRENNYAYIKQLKYPEINKWALKYGLTIDELAWIQPSYSNPFYGDTGCIYSANISLMNGKKIFSIKWSNGDTSATAKNLCPKTYYSCQLRDSLGNLYSDSFYRITSKFGMYMGDSIYIPEIKPFYISLSSTPDDGTCNGTATIKINLGDTSNGYGYYWFHSKDGASTQKNLCAGYYRVAATLLLGPMGYANIFDSVKVYKVTSSIHKSNSLSFKIYPNPFSNIFNIEFNDKSIRPIIKMYDVLGKEIPINVENKNGKYEGALVKYQKGIYFIHIYDQNFNLIHREKIVQE